MIAENQLLAVSTLLSKNQTALTGWNNTIRTEQPVLVIHPLGERNQIKITITMNSWKGWQWPSLHHSKFSWKEKKKMGCCTIVTLGQMQTPTLNHYNLVTAKELLPFLRTLVWTCYLLSSDCLPKLVLFCFFFISLPSASKENFFSMGPICHIPRISTMSTSYSRKDLGQSTLWFFPNYSNLYLPRYPQITTTKVSLTLPSNVFNNCP